MVRGGHTLAVFPLRGDRLQAQRGCCPGHFVDQLLVRSLAAGQLRGGVDPPTLRAVASLWPPSAVDGSLAGTSLGPRRLNRYVKYSSTKAGICQ